MPLDFYIALYDIEEPGFYHWALVAVPENAHITGPVHVFQIIGKQPGYQSEDGFMSAHGVYSLMKSGNFVCAIRLPSVNMKMWELTQYMISQPVGRRGLPLIKTPTKRWSCFQWAMYALQGLIFSNALITESHRSSFTREAVSHPEWGTKIHIAARAAADNAMNGQGVDRSSGVPQMSLERSSIYL